jgi:hypothetical protein
VFATLALLAGFAAREPARPHLARVELAARGPLIAADDHPEWKQFLIQAAYRRAGEIDRLRELPVTPMIVAPEPEPEPAVAPDEKTAALPKLETPADAISEDITGAINEPPAGAIPVEIGEASSTELPLSEREAIPTMQSPESLKLPNDSQHKPAVKPRAKARIKPPAKPAEEPDLLTRIFGSRPTQ